MGEEKGMLCRKATSMAIVVLVLGGRGFYWGFGGFSADFGGILVGEDGRWRKGLDIFFSFLALVCSLGGKRKRISSVKMAAGARRGSEVSVVPRSTNPNLFFPSLMKTNIYFPCLDLPNVLLSS